MSCWRFSKLVLACAIVSVSNAYALQDTTRALGGDAPYLTLNDCLSIGVRENLGLKNERINVKQSRLRARIYKTSLVFPDINMNARLSEVLKPGGRPEFSQAVKAYSNFEVFDMANAPIRRKHENDVLLREYWVRTNTADLQQAISIAYIEANLVRKKQRILLDQALHLDSLLELSETLIDTGDYLNPIARLKDNILPLKESVMTQLKALETSFEDKIGELNNLMSLDNTHHFRLADELRLSDNGIDDENAFVKKLIEKAVEARSEDEQIRKDNLEEEMKVVNSAYFPDIAAGVAYEEDFITNFKGFTANLIVSYNVLDPNAKKKKDIAKLDIEKINNSILENQRNIERWIRGNYNKSKEHRSQARWSLVESQEELYKKTLQLFFSGEGAAISAGDVIDTFKDYYDAQINYYSNIAYSEIQKMYIRGLLMDFYTPFDQLDEDI